MLNLETEKEKQDFRRYVFAHNTKLRNYLNVEIEKYLNKLYNDIAKAADKGSLLDYEWYIKNRFAELQEILKTFYIRMAANWIATVESDLEQVSPKNFIRYEKKGFTDSFWAVFLTWLGRESVKRASLILRTTRLAISHIISNGLRNGFSFTQISGEIRRIGGIRIPSRAMRIAQTEAHTAYSSSTHHMMLNSRMVQEKEWGAVMDAKTRDPHAIANGQRVPISQPFFVGGEQLMYPGDPAGSPENTIHCRCVVSYYTYRS